MDFENTSRIEGLRNQWSALSSLGGQNVDRPAEPTYDVRLAFPHELDEVFSLRYDVFLAGVQSNPATMRDVDVYDSVGDHLIVKHDGRIVATYRVLPMDRVIASGLNPYASTEFNISSLLETLDPRQTIELGRSCVHPAYRQGAIPKMLWSALARYMTTRGKTEAVGCVSVFNRAHSEALALVNYFKSQGSWSVGAECPALNAVCAETSGFDDAHLKSLVPPLLRSYLMLGAKVLGGPAYDPEFRCHDFLMHFSTTTMSERCRKTIFS